MPLTGACFYACRALKDISPLKNAKLQNLNIENTVGDLSPLRGQPSSTRGSAPTASSTPLRSRAHDPQDPRPDYAKASPTSLRSEPGPHGRPSDRFTAASDSRDPGMEKLRILSVMPAPT